MERGKTCSNKLLKTAGRHTNSNVQRGKLLAASPPLQPLRGQQEVWNAKCADLNSTTLTHGSTHTEGKPSSISYESNIGVIISASC